MERRNQMDRNAFLGKILRVDLSSRKWRFEEIDSDLIRMYLGGIGLASKILYEETGPQTQPLSPENVVIVSAGMLNGTDAPTSYRSEVTTKSPLTGIVGSGNFGGLFGSKLRRAGFEAVVLTGKSKSPVYLAIDGSHIELKSAAHLWGKDTWETTDAIRKELGEDFSVMAIGQAGENLVKFACPVVDYFYAPGRSTAGCVMGSKNIKAIALRGTGKLPIARPEALREVSREIDDRIRDYPERGLRLEVGSTQKVAEVVRKGGMGGKNYQTGVLPESNEIWRPEEFKKYLVKGPGYCGNCLLSNYYGCSVGIDVNEGKFKGLRLQGTGFSHPLFNWGGKCAIESLPAMLKCKEMCNRYGMDQMGPIPFALELFERGMITKEDLDGDELKWGDVDAIINLISKIAHRQGIGDILAEGSARAAEMIGGEAPKYAFTIKGKELQSGADPRAAGMSVNLGHMVCSRGGDDLKTTHTIIAAGVADWAKKQGMSEQEYTEWLLGRLDMDEEVKKGIYGVPPSLEPSRRPPEGTALLVKWFEDMSFVRDSLGICLFAVNYWAAMGPAFSARLFNAALGLEISPEEMMKSGERIANLMKAYNTREGLTRLDDNLPQRFFSEPLDRGSAESPPLSKDKLEQLLDAYYELRGWNKATGRPTKEKLEELGLEGPAEELVRRGLID